MDNEDILTDTDLLALEVYLRGVQQQEGPQAALRHFEQMRHDVKVRYFYSVELQRLELRSLKGEEQVTKKKQKSSWRKTINVVMLLLIALILCLCFVGPLFINSGNNDTNAAPAEIPLEPERAAAECEAAAHVRLVNPESAVFAKYKQGEEVFRVRNRPKGWYLVTSYVDAKNAFGAVIRNHYECVAVVDEQSFWRIDSFQFVE